LPEHVQKRGSRNEDDPDAHALQIIQSRNQSLEIATIAYLSFSPIALKHGSKKIVVGRITISELVQ
jgi:hypothetical protein